MEIDPESVPVRGGLLKGLRTFLQTEEQKLEAAKANVEERRARLHELEGQYQRLIIERDGRPIRDGGFEGGLKNRLAAADAEFDAYKARRAQLAESLRTVWWGASQRAGNMAENGYAALLALDAAIADYPNARKVIADQLAQIESSIKNFEREHLSR
ncbi:MAG: hypothetical protein QM796_20690 [Chthoniobacteraceae bacterium]